MITVQHWHDSYNILIEWLEKDCLGYFKEWEESVKTTTDVDDKTKKKNATFKRNSDGNRDDKYAIVLLTSCVYANFFPMQSGHLWNW